SGIAVPLEERLLEAGITSGRAHELVASGCRVLAEELSTEALTAVRAAVPPSLAGLLTTPAQDLSPPSPGARPHATPADRAPGGRAAVTRSARRMRSDSRPARLPKRILTAEPSCRALPA